MVLCCGNLLLLCCGNFCVPVRESFYKKLSVRRCKRLGTCEVGGRSLFDRSSNGQAHPVSESVQSSEI